MGAIESSDRRLQAEVLSYVEAISLLELRSFLSAYQRPRDDFRRAVLRHLAFAMGSSGVALPKTRGGLFEKIARIVLPIVGDAQLPADFLPWTIEAIDSYRPIGGATGTEERTP